MISFEGKLSEKCLENSLYKKHKVGGYICLIVGIVSLLMTVLTVFISSEYVIEFAIMSAILFILTIVFFIKPNPKMLSNYYFLPIKINIDKEKSIISQVIQGKSVNYKLEYVKQVIDMGEWYNIAFKYDSSAMITCQKNLIVEGTIEDFEKLFADKIIRKY
ncbi:MAG: hypothetical protein ACLRFR_03525 [Clostridia bacterium]